MTAIFGISNTRDRKICDDAGVAQTKERSRALDKLREQVSQDSRSATCAVVTMSIKRLIDLGCYRGTRHRKEACRPAASARNATRAKVRKAIAGKGLKG